MKRRLFRAISTSSDPGAFTVYLDHISKRAGAHYPLGTYLPAARQLFQSMRKKGFDPAYRIPVNNEGVILGGAHRTACASVLGIPVVIQRVDTDGRYPPWGRDWFIRHGMEKELPWIESEFEQYAYEAGGGHNAGDDDG